MVKVEVIENFSLSKFNELKNIVRKSIGKEGYLFTGDIFECNEELADYLMGNNSLNKVVVKVIEIIPEKEKTTKKTTRQKATSSRKNIAKK